ncbi:hypothetical protein BB559_005157 [Furculomyces boomerangus]|uniref:Uncharacterized protein n=2 Tax=Harpellales TaxID=61421 RepID=A0A2T9YAE5_9FUNG|nr:hypothetical protein BB559_007404 [Furculomyces boomerangus]PVU88043.1 hypothetical protein BB559_005746 [Furculomyces boomerangus]PVU89306.1 hypothetical protein BB559_005157 [Furculomyces boomerangus]PVZ97734.1 hypothetical protein BB558_006316 [Smittium angustum]
MKFSITTTVFLLGSLMLPVKTAPNFDDQVARGEEFGNDYGGDSGLNDQDLMDAENQDDLKKRGYNYNNGNGYQNNKYQVQGYYSHGRYWYWDSKPDVSFVAQLRFKPKIYYGQRFEYLYLYYPGFKYRWNTDYTFRSNWNNSAYFRSKWFSLINYNNWKTTSRRY